LNDAKAGQLEDVEDGDDVFVAKVAEELDLAEAAQTVHGVVERGDALYRDLALGGLVHGGADDAIRALGVLTVVAQSLRPNDAVSPRPTIGLLVSISLVPLHPTPSRLSIFIGCYFH
jgi:hypothetical protein